MKCYAVGEIDVTDASWVREYVADVTEMVEARRPLPGPDHPGREDRG